MKQALIVGVALAALLALPAVGWAQSKTNYSGTWTFDEAKSDPAPARGGRGGRGGGGRGGGGGVPASLTITQTASQITIDRAMPSGPMSPGATTSAIYRLDGSESTNALGDVFLSRSKVSWDGANLVITTVKDMGLGPNGQMSEDLKEVYSLADGVLTVTMTASSTPGPASGGQTRKLAYNKKM
jgi:hypothetical protein